MKNIHLNALNLDVPILDRYYFFDDGYVGDITDHIRFLCWKHNRPPVSPRPGANQRQLGGTYPTFENGLKFVYIFYLRTGNGWADVRTRAHEETHALDCLGALPYLQNELTKHGFGVILYEQDDETRACIGSWYSLVAWGQELRPYGFANETDMRAFRLLSESRR